MTVMATSGQISFIKNLYREIGQEPEVDLDNLSMVEASQLIRELREIKDGLAPKEDGAYWYD